MHWARYQPNCVVMNYCLSEKTNHWCSQQNHIRNLNNETTLSIYHYYAGFMPIILYVELKLTRRHLQIALLSKPIFDKENSYNLILNLSRGIFPDLPKIVRTYFKFRLKNMFLGIRKVIILKWKITWCQLRTFGFRITHFFWTK